MTEELPILTNCLRCQRPCRTGTPDPRARAIRVSATKGMCATCMMQWFLQSVPAIVMTLERTGPEIFLNEEWREGALRGVVAGVLAHTQMKEDQIHWIDMVMNWNDPWPAGREPKEGAV